MHVRHLFRPGRPVFSIELFPPKTPQGVENLKKRLLDIRSFAPDYISVTYGAGGSTRQGTLEICAYIKQRLGMEVSAHLTCVAHTREEVASVLAAIRAEGIDNIMVLRGDPPKGETAFRPPPGGFRYAVELVEAVKAWGDFGIGVAGYPEGHAEAESYAADVTRQVEKINAGGEVLVSQFFLDNAPFLRWRDDLRARGVTIPIEAGILPALSAQQITGFATTCGVAVPRPLLDALEKCGDDKAASAAVGLDFALRQIEALVAEGVDGIHLYALNRLEPIRAVEPLVRGKEGAKAEARCP